MSEFVKVFGHGAMSDLSPLSGVKRKLDFGAVRAAFDPTRTFDRLDLYRIIAYARVESIGGMTGNAAARVHNACRWSGGGLAARR